MLVLPIPLAAALALLFLFLHSTLSEPRPLFFRALILASAVQGAVVAGAQHYEVAPLQFVQPVTAAALPPLAWIALLATAVRPPAPRDLVHFVPPSSAGLSVAFAPALLDLLVPGVFLGYGLAILRLVAGGPDGLPKMRIEAGELPRRVWGGVAAALILSAASDALIGLAMAAGRPELRLPIVGVSTALSLTLLGALALSRSIVGAAPAAEPLPDPETEAAERAAAARDAEIVSALDALLRDHALYLDPDLTLDRVARRLRIPAKAVSAAVNRVAGQNVSRHVNAFRIAHACERLRRGDGVTEAMLASGFATKSNFNREFLRVMGIPPSRWTASQAGDPEASGAAPFVSVQAPRNKAG